MELDATTRDDLLKRLRRVEGQVRGIQQMIDDARDCREIVTQVSAATKALEQTGFLIVAAGLRYCIADPGAADAEGIDLEAVQKMFLKLA